ncbi:MAG: RNA polymerase sigma factor [Lachnospiraceae bacterium]
MQKPEALIQFMESCYQLYEQKMYQAAYRILQDRELAEDAVQEAFLKLMRQKTYFENPESDDCKKYLITVIKHAAIDLYHKKKKEQDLLYFPSEEETFDRTFVAPESEEEIDLNELIAPLPPKYHSVVTCLTLKQLSVKETAKELHLTESTVRKRFERAKRILKKNWKGSHAYEKEYNLHRSRIC